MKRRKMKMTKLQAKDLWIAFFFLVLMAVSCPSINTTAETTTGAGFAQVVAK